VPAVPTREGEEVTWEGLSPPYSTIVVDPPWPMPETGKTTRGETDSKGVYTAVGGRQVDGAWWGRHRGGTVDIPYQTMTMQEIETLPVGDLVGSAAHLYLWTTNRFLEDTYRVARGWGFRPAQVLVWAKPPMGVGFGGAFTTTTEFVLFCRRGTMPAAKREDSSWWEWSRVYVGGHIAHSAKPDAFIDMVERVSPGPYVELFARAPRLGWDHWGHGYEIGA
jgi:N6-adenosine-specific RNA methylase IME4